MFILTGRQKYSMKLRLIAEAAPNSLKPALHGIWLENADEIVAQQAAKNIVVTALSKIRKMLGPMGLTKNPIQKHRVTEPIGPAVGPFSNLRMAVQRRAKQDAALMLRGGDRETIGQFWGIQLPTGYYDVHAGQHGRVNAEGQFDELIRQTVAAAEGQPLEARVALLDELAAQL